MTEIHAGKAVELAALRAEAAAAEVVVQAQPDTGSASAEPAKSEAGGGGGVKAGPSPAEPAPAGDPVIEETEEDYRVSLDYALDEWILPERPQLAPVYTAERRAKLAAATYALFKKRGWTMGGLFARWKEEVAMLLVVLPIIRDTREAMARPAPAQAKARPADAAKSAPYETAGVETVRPAE